MARDKLRIGIVAPASRLEPATAERIVRIAEALYPGRVALHFHPQCFLSSGHFAGDDAARGAAFLEIANDAGFDALWFARGGYGSARIVADVVPKLSDAAKDKTYLGYSDMGSLLGALYSQGFGKLAHGPMPADILREGGEEAVRRALAWLVDRAPESLEPSISNESKTAAFNITILGHLIGTPYEPDLSGHVLMLEEVAEHLYRTDRDLVHITSHAPFRELAGIRLGSAAAAPSRRTTGPSARPKRRSRSIGAASRAFPISAAPISATTSPTRSCRSGA
jgi:muramoyltetrapeptide carboxypeptidase